MLPFFAETSATTRRIDPAADLWEATERNALEKREEDEAARREKAEAEKAEASALKKLEAAEAAAAAKRPAKEVVPRRSAVFVTPLNSVPPPPEFTGQSGEAGGEFSIVERGGGDAPMPDAVAPPQPPPPPSRSTQGKQPADPPLPPIEDEAVARLLLQVGSPTRRCLEKATSVPRPLETGTASSTIPDAEATSAASPLESGTASSTIPDVEAMSATPIGWVRGGSTGPLNQALLDVQTKLRAESDTIQNCTKAHLASWAAIRVCFLLCPCYLVSLYGGAPAHPLGVVPEFRASC